MKKFLLFSLAGVLALGLSARVLEARKAIQAPVTNAPVPTANLLEKAQMVTAPKMLQSSKAGERFKMIKAAGDVPATTSAYYSRDLGGFFTGYSVDGVGYNGWNFMTFYPAFTSKTHTAYADEGASLSWVYYDLDDNEYEATGESLTQDLTTSYVYAPELTANDSTFSWGYLSAGGPASLDYNGHTFLATNTDHSWDGNYGNPTQTQVNLTDLGDVYRDVDTGNPLLGIAEFISCDPEHPYVLNGVYPLVTCLETGGTVKLTVIRAMQDEDGVYAGWTDEIVCEAEVEIEPDPDGYSQIIAFEDLMGSDPVSGLDVPLVIDYPVMILLTSEDGAQFYSSWRAHKEDIPIEQHAFLYWMDTDGVEHMSNANWDYNFGTDDDPLPMWATAWNIMYDIDYNYLHTEDDNIEAPVEGGDYDISFLSYYSSTYPWTVEGVDGNDIPDWITVGEFEDQKEESNGQIYYTGETNWTITVAPNEGEAREADIRVFYDGAEEIIHVSQAGSGATPLPGDVNLDGNVNTGDVSAVYAVILGTETDPGFIERANVNGDGNVNTGDVSALYSIILGNN